MRVWRAARIPVALGLAIGAGVIGWAILYRSDAVAFLADESPAHWILYPTPLDPAARPRAGLPVTFRRQLILRDLPHKATMSVRAFRTSTVRLNGQAVEIEPGGRNWKTPKALDVTTLLKTGANEIDVTVSNASGPPALWLVLECFGPRSVISSDSTWQASWAGATWKTAIPVSSTSRASTVASFAQAYRTSVAFRQLWPYLLILIATVAAAMIASIWLARRSRIDDDRFWRLASSTLLAAVALAWIVLVIHNTSWLPATIGYDAEGHLAYIDFIQRSGTFPLADQGWSMHHPPLYYLLMAGVLQILGSNIHDAGGITAIRMVNLALGLTTLTLVLLTMRQLFPRHPRRWFIGLLIAGFLPANLYLHQYPTNEVLTATLATASIYLAVRATALWEFAALGAAMGAAMLSKASALPIVICIVVTLAVKARKRPGAIAIMLGLCLAICGWHYARVWHHFGKPFVANWDPVSGFRWWQDPGYRRPADLLWLGRSIDQPLMDLDPGIPGGFYETLCGDAYLGGASTIDFAPPWSYPRMTIGYILELIPVFAFASGLIALIRGRRGVKDGLVISIIILSATAMLWVAFIVPGYSVLKGFFVLPALSAACAVTAVGFDVLSRSRQWARSVLLLITLVAAVNSYCTYWIDTGSAETRLLKARDLLSSGNLKDGAAMLQGALQANPANPRVRVAAAEFAIHDNDFGKARALLEPTVTDLSARHELLSFLANHDGNRSAAVAEMERAIGLDPCHAELYVDLASLLESGNDLQGAVRACCDALSINPFDARVHAQLASLYTKLSQPKPAAEQQGWAQQINDAMRK